MIRRGLAAVLAALAFAGAAGAQSFEPFTVKDIRVEGLQRTEPGTVFSYLPIKVGETVNQERAREAVRALYATGFFSDVRLEHENDVLVVFVQERPAIAQIDFSGMKEFEPDAVRKVLRENGLAEGRIFDRSVLENAEQELKRQYLSRGLYGAEVQTTVTPLERNRVGINIAVSEGEVAKIRGINIVGAQAFSESELVGLFVLRTPGWLTWYTKHDRYAREKLSDDLETLRSYYQNRGYLDFAIESTQVSITPDRHDIYITVNITEGERYTVSDVQLSGQTPVPRAELEKLVQLKPGDVFSREKLAASTKAIGERLGNDGYALANAHAIPKVDKEKGTVAFNIVVHSRRRTRRITPARSTSWSTPAGACTGGASTSRAIPRPATRWCAARCASSRARSTTPPRSSCRGGASSAPGTSARPPSRPSRSREAPTRSTCCTPSRSAPPARCSSAWASPAWRSSRSPPRSASRTPSAPASSSPPTSTAAR